MKCTNCSREVLPVIALDIDGTLAQYHDHFLGFMDMYFGRVMKRGWDGSGNWEDYLGLTRSEYEDAKLAFRQGGFKRWMPSFEGLTTLMRMTAKLEVEVWITTTRPYQRLDSVDPDTRFWLRNNGVHYDHLLYDEDKYLRLKEIVGDRVILVLEDLPEYYEQAVSAWGSQVPIMIEREHNKAYRQMMGELDGVRSFSISRLSMVAAIIESRVERIGVS